MENTLNQTVLDAFTDQVTDDLGSRNQVAGAAIRNGLSHTVPFSLYTLLNRVEGPYGPEIFWQLSREAYDAHVTEHLPALDQTGWQKRGEDLLHDLLGDSYTSVLQEQSAATNLAPGVAAQLLGCSTVAVLGVAGEHAREHSLDPVALALWLRQEKDPLRRALLSVPQAAPAGGLEKLPIAPPDLAPYPAAAAWATAPAGPAAGPTARWQWGLLLLLAVLLGYLFGHDRLGAPAASLATPAAAVTPTRPAPSADTKQPGRYDDASGNYIYDTGQPIILRLADGTTQKVGANSTENRLFTFLADPAIQVDSVNRTKGWINFDRVYFEPGATTLTDESFLQLRNVASILKTFPTSVVKIGGYTDSTGNPLKNFQLSEERAKTAMLAMAGMGIDMNRIQAKGYGGKYFITPNTTPEGRALNRRISIRVIKK
ncbi:OmpA family protein [Hymenobacter yonginensis]|uniref:OmpA family protein n=1 Tax=Hymenobacter yonginensis TaxID=748197 RepID=A0ABY7PPU4_9BACT|nr:OmpA family protein [Hymenobacter yonginensis]WBO84699.1 OmpA family protein [Hymenobacter yonginensis]